MTDLTNYPTIKKYLTILLTDLGMSDEEALIIEFPGIDLQVVENDLEALPNNVLNTLAIGGVGQQELARKNLLNESEFMMFTTTVNGEIF